MQDGDTILKINLSAHSDKYATDSLEFSISKKVNFVFGKNGTGKTTIADEIYSQLSDSHSVHVFKDFEGVAANERLDAVALGTDNAKIQKQLDVVDGEIADIKKEVMQPEDDTENLYTKAKVAKKKYDDQQTKIDRFYSAAASQIKSQNNPQIASPNYDRNAFRSEISSAKLSDDAGISAYKDTIKADRKPDVPVITLPVIELETYLKSTNEVLGSSVKQSSVIPELDGNPRKQQFAKIGMDTHEHKAGETCAFCGNTISEERWIALASHFNDEVRRLEGRIKSGIEVVLRDLGRLDAIKDIDERFYYGKYVEQVKSLDTKIKLRKAEYSTYLSGLEKSLEDKKDNLFAASKLLQLEIPDDFSSLQEEYTDLIDSSNQFSKDLTNEQSKAKDALRYHEIQKKLNAFKYTDETTALATLYELSDAAQRALAERTGELSLKRQKRTELISQTKDEKAIAVKINGLLKNMGVTSFELELVDDKDENQKGQYQIRGHNGNIRQVTALSKGEKNIIAFLYFMLDLERTDGDSRPKIIVLDDPMTSNDDTMQYIMINEIQKAYRKLKDGNYFVLLTHNVHFYLNTRPNTAQTYKIKESGEEKEISFYEKYGVYHLLSDGKCSAILNIKKGKNDFRTSYETLWKELVFLHGAKDATADIMLSPCRKICETYMHFTKKELDKFYGENTSAKKLFDVNQHSIDDLEAEMNGKTKDEIRDILKGLFRQNGAEDHFNNYWKGSGQ